MEKTSSAPPPFTTTTNSLSTENLWTGDDPLRLSMQKLAVTNDLSSISATEATHIRNVFNRIELDTNKLQKITTRRELDLANLVLQDLEMHFESNPISTLDPLYARMSLLNLTKEGENKYDSVFNARTQGLDTFAALKFLDGKKIVFDVEDGEDGEDQGGSFIHPDGTIHMPKRCRKDDTITEATLSTAFFNISIEEGGYNSDLQKSLNDLAFGKLKELDQIETDKIKKGLEDISTDVISRSIRFRGKKPDVATARKIIQTIKKRPDCHVSVNSYEGKDETGNLLALMTKSALKKSCSENYEKMKDVWKHQLQSKEEGVRAKIARAQIAEAKAEIASKSAAKGWPFEQPKVKKEFRLPKVK